MNKKKIANFAIILLALISQPIPANAIENGSDALNNSIVVRIELNFANYTTWCSGALLAPRIVVTADHCIKLVGENNKNNVIQSAKVAPTGAARDLQTSSYINVTNFIFTPREGKNGAAFLVLESMMELRFPVRIASASDINDLQFKRTPISFVGYGTTDRNQAVYTNSPQIAQGELFKDLENSHVHLRSNPGAPCAGDSGGPVIQQLEAEILLIGVVQGPWYLDGKTFCPIEVWNPEAVRQDKVYKYSVYIPLYTTDAISDAKLAADKVLAIPAKPNSNSTEAKATAELKSKQEADAKAAAEFKAKQEAEAKAAAELKAKQEGEAKVAADLKAKQEAEAKAAAELKVKAAADKAAAEIKAKQEADAKAAAELKAKQDAEVKAAADKAALAKAQSELANANAALADAQKVNREQAARITSFEEQFKVLSESVATVQNQLSQLNSKLVAALTGLNTANAKIKKICAAKPKPKGC